MIVSILAAEENLRVEFDNIVFPKYIFQTDGQINLTDLVKETSNIGELLELNPADFSTFKSSTAFNDPKMLKIAEYIYKILDAYNKSYNEIFPLNI